MEYNLINSIAESAKNGKTAMINNGNIISYKELKDKIDRACLYMKEETGIKERSLVLLVTPRCVEQIELMLTFFSLNIAYCNIDFNEKKTRIRLLKKQKNLTLKIISYAADTTLLISIAAKKNHLYLTKMFHMFYTHREQPEFQRVLLSEKRRHIILFFQ